MIDVIGLVVPFFALILIGFILGKRASHELSALGWMNTFVIYVALPALFFKLMAKTPVEQFGEWHFVLGATGSTFLLFMAVLLAVRLLARHTMPVAMIQGFASAYGNIGYMGPGLALTAFGEQAAVPVALIFCFDNALHFTMAPFIMGLSDRKSVSLARLAGQVLVKILTHPFILATLVGVGFAISGLELPKPMTRLVDLLANAAAPCALFAMGVTLAMRNVTRIPAEMAYIAPLKLIAHPLLVWVMLSIAGDFPSVWVFAAMLMASLPSATNVFVLAQQYDTWTEKASAAVLITTCLSIVSVSMLIYLVGNGLIAADLFPQ
ncbi:MAG: AEC family transporter [Rhizobiaceae bacterium]